MSYKSLNLMDGDILTASHIRYLESGMKEIENEIDNMKTSLVNTLQDKGLNVNADESFSSICQKITTLQKAPEIYEYTGDVIDITNVESDSIKMVFSDANNGSVSFDIAATTGIKIDWGDGTIDTYFTSPNSFTAINHKYALGQGEYLDGINTQIVATVTPLVPNGITGWRVNSVTLKCLLAYASKDIYYTYTYTEMFRSAQKLEYIYMDGGNYGTAESSFSMANMFMGCSKLKSIKMSVSWRSVTSLSQTFYICPLLNNIDMGSNWDTINCTSMASMFYGCQSLVNAPAFKTNSATSMNTCFYNCTMLETIGGSWDLSACTSFNQVFSLCEKLIELPILNNMYNILTMESAFSGCKQLVSFPEEQGEFDTESCTNFNYLFLNCNSLEETPRINTDAATSIYQAFYNCSSLFVFGNTILNLPNVVGTIPSYASNSVLTALDGLFYQCTSLTTAPTIIAPNALSALSLFNGCTSLVNVPDINLPEAIRANYMFNNCTSLQTAPSNIVMPKCQNIINMFYGCSSLRTAPNYQSGSLEFPEAILAYNLFYGCNSLVNPPMSIKLQKATDIYSMFEGCASLINAGNMTIEAPLAKNIYKLFYGCTKLSNPPAVLNFPEAISAQSIFYYCNSLLVCPELNLPNATNVSQMFYYCESLTTTLAYEFPCVVNASEFYRGCRGLISMEVVKLGGNAVNINYFFYEGGSKFEVLNFPETLYETSNINWTYIPFQVATNGSIFKKYNNYVDFKGANSYAADVFNSTTIEEVKLKNFNSSFTLNSKPYLTSVRMIDCSPSMGNISLQSCALSAAAINQLFTDLPTVTSARTINVKGNPGALTCDTSIATAKNWVVTTI